MSQRFKQLGSCLIILVLLPYVVTVFVSGPGIAAQSRVDAFCVRVSAGTGDKDGKQSPQTIEMPVEDYCIGVMAREIPADYEKEALMAQAVLVRTDVYRRIGSEGSGAVLEEDFWSQEQMEEAWGASHYPRCYQRLKNAWQNTEGQVLMYKGKPAAAPFCRLSNGCTRRGKEVLGRGYPYLRAVECPKDIEAEEQIQTVTVDDMDAEIKDCDSAGYVLRVSIGDEEMSGEEFRTRYHLASSCFTLQKFNGKVRITTRGVGHGLGMSQYTANAMAKEGREYTEILDHFFEGTQLAEVADIVQTEE